MPSPNWQRLCYSRLDFPNKRITASPSPTPTPPGGRPRSADRSVLKPTRPHFWTETARKNGRDIFRRWPSYGEHFLFLQIRKERSDPVKPLLLAPGLNSYGSERADCRWASQITSWKETAARRERPGQHNGLERGERGHFWQRQRPEGPAGGFVVERRNVINCLLSE